MPDAYRAVLLIRELVDEADLHLELVGGKAGINNAVEAVYTGDLEDPTPWMVQKSLLLTTGPTFESDPDTGPRLVRLMSESGMAGIGVAILPHLTEIPPQVIAAADDVGLPLLRVPPDTPFRAIAGYVYNALSSRDMHRLRRSLAMQNQLLEASQTGNSMQSLVERLANLLEVDIVLFDAGGRVLAQALHRRAQKSTARLDRKVWTVYSLAAGEEVPRSVVSTGAVRIHYREVKIEGVLERVLIAVPPLESVSSELMEASLTYAQRLIALSLAADRTVVGARRRTRAGLLDMIVEGRGGRADIEERLLQHGILTSDPLWLAVIGDLRSRQGESPAEPAGTQPLPPSLLTTRVEHLLDEDELAFLASPREAGAIVLSAFGADQPLEMDRCAYKPRGALERLVAELRDRPQGETIAAGVSAAISTIDQAPRALAQATLAHRTSAKLGKAVCLYDELGVGYKAVDSLPEPALESLAQRVVGTLRDVDAREGTNLLTTLATFLGNDCSHACSAAELFVHRNTLRGRLERIAKLIDANLGTTDGVVEARLGLLASEVLATRRA